MLNDRKCKCWEINHTFASFLSEFVERKSVKECASGGGYLQYTECKCKLCGRTWDEQ
jgi:hypothetical protein